MLPPPNGTRRTILKPVDDADIPMLHKVEIAWHMGYRLRSRGTHPSPEQFRSAFWNDTQAAFLVVERKSRTACGLVTLYGADLAQRRLFCSVVQFALVSRRGLAMEGAMAAVRYAFWTWPLERVLFEAPGFNTVQFAKFAASNLRREGSIGNFWFMADRWWSHDFYSVDRSRAEELANGRFRRLLEPVETGTV